MTLDPIDTHLLDLTLPDPRKQVVALKALGSLGAVQALPRIVALLDAKEAPVRGEAVRALGKLRRPEAIEPLIRTLKTDTAGVRAKAILALAQIPDPRVVPALIGALGDPYTKVNAVAADALGRLGNPRAVPVLIAIVEDPDRTAPRSEYRRWNGFGLARAAAITALGKLCDSRAIPALIQALGDEHCDVDYAAVHALAKFGESAVPSLLEALESANVNTRHSVLWTLDLMGCHNQFGAVIPLLKDPSNHVRENAAYYLGRCGDLQAGAVIPLLKDPDIDVRQSAAYVLGRCGDPQAVPALVELLHDTSTDAAISGAAALLALGEDGREALKSVLEGPTGRLAPILVALWWSTGQDPRFVPPVLAILRSDDPVLRQKAACALGSLKDERAVLPLITALQDDDPLVRRHSAEALEHLRDPQSIEPLIALMQDPNVGVRIVATNILARIGGERVMEAFMQVLERVHREEQPLSAANAVGVINWLGVMGDKRCVELLVAIAERPEIQAQTREMHALIRTLGSFRDNRAVGLLIRLLQSEEFDLAAAVALGEIGDRSAVKPIIMAMLSRTTQLEPMIRALGSLGDARAIAPLIAVLAKQTSIDPMSMGALGQVGAVSALIGYTKHPNEYIRVNAVEALSEITAPGQEREAMVHSLMEALQDRKSVVRSMARRALGKLGVKVSKKAPVNVMT